MLGFTDAERPAEDSPQIKGRGAEPAAGPAVVEIAEALRPGVLAYLRQADGQVGIHELRTELGTTRNKRLVLNTAAIPGAVMNLLPARTLTSTFSRYALL